MKTSYSFHFLAILATILSGFIITYSEAQIIESDKLYWKRGTYINFGENSLKLSTEFRSRYQYTSKETSRDTSEFRVTQARIATEGSLFDKQAGFFLKTELADDEAYLLDGGINVKLPIESNFKIGQYKPRFSRQYVAGEFRTQFPDYALISDNADRERRPMMTLSHKFEDKSSLYFELINGELFNQDNNKTDHFYLTSWQTPITGELDPFTEGDLEYTEKFASDFGLTYAYGDLEAAESHNLSSNINMKYQGHSLHSEVFSSTKDGEDNSDFGFYIQSGKFILPKKAEIALRYGRMNCADNSSLKDCIDSENFNEYGVSFIYFFWEHYLKMQLGHSIIEKELADSGSETDQRTVLQICAQF